MVAARRPRGELAAFVRESPIHRPAILATVESFADSLAPGSRLLDAGAGQSPYRVLFQHCDYVSHDWPASPHERAAVSDIVGDLCELPIEDAAFDAVLCTEVLEHVATPDRACAELLRILRPGGRGLITVPFVAELHEEPHDHYRYTSYGLRGLLERAGFEVERVAPLTGYYGTLAHMLRVGGLATRAPGRRSRPGTRVLGVALQGLSVLLAPLLRALDRIDERRALPLGWAAWATAPSRD